MSQLDLYPFQLLDVRLFEATIERFEPDELAEVEAEPEGGPEQPLPLGISLDIEKHSPKYMSVFLGLQLEYPPGQARTICLSFVLEGLFKNLLDPEDITHEVWQEFEDLSAINLLWPYAREYMNSFAERARIDLPLLPTVNQLRVVRPSSEEPDQAASQDSIVANSDIEKAEE